LADPQTDALFTAVGRLTGIVLLSRLTDRKDLPSSINLWALDRGVSPASRKKDK